MRASFLIAFAIPVTTASAQSFAPAAARALDSSGVSWAKKETAHTTVYVAKGSAAAPRLSALASGAEKAVASNLAWLGSKTTSPKLRLFFVGSREEMRPFTGGTPGGWSVTDEGTAFFVANDSIQPAVKHETMHLLATRIWGKPAGTWLQEGIATAAVGSCQGQSVEQVAASARMAGMFVPLDTLRRAFSFGGEVGVVHYYEAASLVRYIDRIYGRKKLEGIWSSGLDDAGRVLGIAPDSLEKKWRVSLSNVTPTLSWPRWWSRVQAHGCE